jgi:hypothetical protein
MPQNKQGFSTLFIFEMITGRQPMTWRGFADKYKAEFAYSDLAPCDLKFPSLLLQ